MQDKEVHLERLTRREFREAIEAGHFKSAIIATGSVEQHLEHLAMVQDIASSTHIAERVANNLYPNVVVAVPINVGVAEHHMKHPGTLTTKPETWLAVILDATESLLRHGVKKVLILNGHGGNRRPIYGAISQWKTYFRNQYGEVDVRFNSYWDVLSHEFVSSVQDAPGFPSHAREFETSFTMHVHPENVRSDAIPYSEDEGAAAATAEKGKLLVDKTVEGVTAIVQEMLEGKDTRAPMPDLSPPKRETEESPIY